MHFRKTLPAPQLTNTSRRNIHAVIGLLHQSCYGPKRDFVIMAFLRFDLPAMDLLEERKIEVERSLSEEEMGEVVEMFAH